MSNSENSSGGSKKKLHPRNVNRKRYDLEHLSRSYPPLKEHIYINQYEDKTIDFFDPKAVTTLNKALLKTYYQIDNYDLPQKYLCPPIPGRADYIHHVADLLVASGHFDLDSNSGSQIKCLDIGTGANCIYPILGARIYDWNFVASDINKEAINYAKEIAESNPILNHKIEFRHQPDSNSYFNGIIRKGEKYDLSICNPPFHASAEEAKKAALRKLRNLKQKNIKTPNLNFGGISEELWYPGGEKQFLINMIKESKGHSEDCRYFTSLVSKESNLPAINKALINTQVKSSKIIQMGQGNKQSRIVVWSFMP